MRKYNRIINIGNENFKLIKDIKIEDIKNRDYKHIYSCYDRPSNTKISIFNKWYDILLNNCNVIFYGICSYNCNMFSLNAIIEIENQKYYIYITKTRQEIYKIID